MGHVHPVSYGIVTLLILFVWSLSGLAMSDAATPEKAQPAPQFQVSKDKEIQQIKPKKPVRVKLHRNAKGEYSWDLTAENVDDVIKADKRLRKLLNLE